MAHFTDAELLDLLGCYVEMAHTARRCGVAFPDDGRATLYRLALAAHQRGLLVGGPHGGRAAASQRIDVAAEQSAITEVSA